MIERVAQDRAADGLQFRCDFTDPDRILGLQRHRCDLRANLSQLPYRETGQRDAKQQQCAKTAIEPAANPEIKKHHGGEFLQALRVWDPEENETNREVRERRANLSLSLKR